MGSFAERQGHLTPFERLYGAVILGWVGSDEELFWLAPRTEPPLTVEKIEAWTREEDCPFLFWGDDPQIPVGYGEINRMPHDRNHWWLGHLIIAPHHRGRGWGQTLVRALLHEGFVRLRAREISLVVFPENEPAIRCYRRCGMRVLGDQLKEFGAARRRYRMLHMGLAADRYLQLTQGVDGTPAQKRPG